MSDKDKIINNIGGVPFSEYDTSYNCEDDSLLLDVEFKPKTNDLKLNNPEIIWGYDCVNNSITIDINVDTDDDSRIIRIKADAYYGSDAYYEIGQAKIINFNANYGIDATFEIKKAVAFNHSGYNGTWANGQIYVPISLYGTAYYDSTASQSLYLIKQFWNDSSYGSLISYEIVLPKILSYNAQYGTFTNYSLSLPKLITNTASYGTLTNYALYVSEADYIVAYNGSEATYKFYKYKTIGSNAYYGAIANQIYQRDLIKIRQNASYGAYIVDSRNHLYMEFITRLPCNFDLPKKYDNTDIDLSEDIFDQNIENPDVWYRVEGSLSRKPVFFGFEASYGARMVEVEKIKLTSNAYFGGVGDATRMNMYDPDISFCIGNTVLNGNGVMIDFNIPDRSCRFAKGAYYGASVDYTLFTNPTTAKNAYYGAFATFKFVEYVEYRSYFGTSASYYLITDRKFNVDILNGSSATFKMRPREYITHYGASAHFKLSMIYKLEFLEDGCLENEYIPTKPDGTIDYDNLRTQAIEGKQYNHTIKRRVFY